MRDHHNENENHRNKVTSDRKFGDQVDSDYAWLLSSLTETNDHTNTSIDEIVINEHEDADVDLDADEDEDEDVDVDEDVNDNDKDPQYQMFLKELTENGKSYMLKISKSDEPPCFLKYEEEEPVDTNINIGNNGDKIESHHDKTADSCYRMFLDGCVHSEYGAFVYDGNRVNYEEKETSSDSDIEIWDNVEEFGEANKKQPVTAEKDPSLKEKLMCTLRQPFNEEEYEKLLKYVEQKKPVCRLLPLRDRAISSAVGGVTKSVLDDVPANFRKKLKAAQNERPRALNLLRMFCFWLEYLPNNDIFKPWLDDDCLKVLPASRV